MATVQSLNPLINFLDAYQHFLMATVVVLFLMLINFFDAFKGCFGVRVRPKPRSSGASWGRRSPREPPISGSNSQDLWV